MKLTELPMPTKALKLSVANQHRVTVADSRQYLLERFSVAVRDLLADLEFTPRKELLFRRHLEELKALQELTYAGFQAQVGAYRKTIPVPDWREAVRKKRTEKGLRSAYALIEGTPFKLFQRENGNYLVYRGAHYLAECRTTKGLRNTLKKLITDYAKYQQEEKMWVSVISG